MAERVLDLTTLGVTPALPTVMRVAWERAAPGYRCVPGRWSFPQTTIQVTLRGCGAVWATGSGAGRPVPVGHALLYTSPLHRELAYGRADGATPWEFLYINLRGTAATAMIGDLAALHAHVAPLASDSAVIRECLELLPSRGHRHRAWALAASSSLAQRLLLALCCQTPQPPTDQRLGDTLIAQAMSELERRLAESWTISSLSRSLGVSREHLTRTFVARAGMPPATWLRRRRMVHAMRLLRGGTAVAEIAHACGFPDPAHFSRIFKQHTGLPPNRFRDSGSATESSPDRLLD